MTLLLVSLLLVLLLPRAEVAVAAEVRPLPAGVDVDYQLGGPVAPAGRVGIVVRDRSVAPAPGRYNVCYVNGFQTQPDERRSWLARPGLLLRDAAGRPVVDEAWGEWLLDLRTAGTRQRLARIVDRWIRGCARSGYDAVELDNLDSFSRSRGLLRRPQALAYARLLVRSAHRAGLAVGQKNLAGLDGTRLGFDFAVAEECGQYRECRAYTRHYGSDVLAIEYTARGFRRACAEVGALVSVVRRDVGVTPGGIRRWC